MRLPIALFALALAACDVEKLDTPPDRPPPVEIVDGDLDGVLVADDCDDLDASVGAPFGVYIDRDGDAYGRPGEPTVVCVLEAGVALNEDDCADSDPRVHPGADEVCNGHDDDCDGTSDVDALDPLTWHDDADGDGFGAAGAGEVGCEGPPGSVADDADCDDADAGRYPGNVEVCDAADVDEDCDGRADDADGSVSDARTWLRDLDGDGYGSDARTVVACDPPSDFVSNGGDCDDTDALFHPGADESDCADPSDYNCDGSTGFTDLDRDGWAACAECDDGDAAVSPGAAERCNDLDDDCDGDADGGAVDAPPWYADVDDDGHGAGDPTVVCDAPDGTVASGDDCDDDDPAISPSAAERCDGSVDEDCDGLLDDADPSVTGTSAWYDDADGDGYGDAGARSDRCLAPGSGVADATDCDDARGAVNPGAVEVCDEAWTDEDCDGEADDADDAPVWYVDADADQHGSDDAWRTACGQPDGYAAPSDDCDDAEPSAYPGAAEIPDGMDNDCDGIVD